jgi:hypothetical protein
MLWHGFEHADERSLSNVERPSLQADSTRGTTILAVG